MARKAALILAVAGMMTGTASGAEVTIGLAVGPSSIDPHYQNLGANNEIRRHMFESLTWQDERRDLWPLLATAWKAVDDRTWEFQLRRNVAFHDGSEFTAKDVIYTACRIRNVVDSPSPFTLYTDAISSIEAPDPYTLIIGTAEPHPRLPVELAEWGILSAQAYGVTGDMAYGPDKCTGVAAWPKKEDFDSGRLAVGTGPFKFAEFVKGDRLVMVRNAKYWGYGSGWAKLTVRLLPDDAARTDALLAGEVDIISKPPSPIQPLLQNHGGFALAPGLSARAVYLHFDHVQEPSPGIAGTGGRNPFKDRRVRMAGFKAIDRAQIIEQTRDGAAVPAAELLPLGFTDGELYPVDGGHDPQEARRLLADAGYPNGFELVLATPRGRFSDGAGVAGAVARMLTDVGIRTTVEALPADAFLERRSNYEFSLFLGEWASGMSEPSAPLRALVASRGAAPGLGGTNWGRYSNPRLDELILNSMTTADEAERATLLQRASNLAMDDYAVVPLYHERTTWAHRWGLAYDTRVTQENLTKRIVPCTPCHELPVPRSRQSEWLGVWQQPVR